MPATPILALPVSPASVRTSPALASEIAVAAALADQLAKARVLPKHIRSTGQAVAIMLIGRELGIGPMAAMRSIALNRGKIILAADLQLALWTRDGGHVRWLRSDRTTAELWLRHPNGDEHTQRFDAEDAARAGLWGAPGPWTRYPAAMLRARAVTAGLKAIGYILVTGAYDGESMELPGSAAPDTNDERGEAPAAPTTLAAIDTTLDVLRLHSPEDADRAAAALTARREHYRHSERRARRFLANVRARVEVLAAQEHARSTDAATTAARTHTTAA